MWNEIVANIKDFFNQPVPIIGCTIGFVLVFILVILSKTSFGRKALKFLKGKVAELEKEYNEFKEATSKQVEDLKSAYEEKLNIAESKVAVLEEVILIVADQTHNEQVKKAVDVCKEKLSVCKTNYELLVEEKVNEAQKEIEKYELTLKEKYEAELSEYKSKFDNLLAEAEKASQNAQNNVNLIKEVIDDGKERINTDSEEETIPEN